MSRPALYLLFPGKEQAFEAAVLNLSRLRMAEIEAALAACPKPSEQLFIACDLWLVRVFELKFGNADARDMDDLSFPVVVTVYRQLQERIARILAGYPRLPAPADELSRILVFAVRGLGATAVDPDEMRRLTRREIDLFCRALVSDA